MKTITVEGIEYRCPTSWDEITLEMQIKVTKDSELFNTETTKRLSLISGYLGIDPMVLRKMDVKVVAQLFKHFTFLSEPVPDKLVSDFTFKGYKYHVAQNLIKQEFQDFVSLENVMNDTKGDVLTSLPYVIAILAKREDKDNGFESLDDYDVEERADLFKKLPISIANGIGVFFYTSVSTSTTVSQLYSKPENLIAMKVEEVENTLSKQVGQGWLTKLQVGVLRLYLKSIKKASAKYFTSTQQKS